MPPYLRLGSIPRKRHIAHSNVPGFKNEGIYYEEVVTVSGFSRAYSLVYHLRPPTRVVRIEPAGSARHKNRAAGAEDMAFGTPLRGSVCQGHDANASMLVKR